MQKQVPSVSYCWTLLKNLTNIVREKMQPYNSLKVLYGAHKSIRLRRTTRHVENLTKKMEVIKDE